MQKITPFLWFDTNAEEAVNFYCSVFSDSKITDVTRYGDPGPGPKGSVMTISYELNGQKFTAINGGPYFKFTEAISFVVWCDTQEEIDDKWAKLSEGGQEVQCGWLKDKYGLAWQIVPPVLIEMLKDENTEKEKRATQAMHKMIKLDIKTLQDAYNGA